MIAAVLVLSGAALSQVELRGGMYVSAPVMSVTFEGVEVGGDEPRTIGWDSVKLVMGEHAEAAKPFYENAEKAWRARTRLARGDIELACPLFDELFHVYKGHSGPTALMVAEGRIRCLTRQGDHASAVEAWIDALRMRRAGDEIAGDPPLLPVLDEDMGLVPTLPPIWLATLDTESVANADTPDTGDPVAKAFASLYRSAARVEIGKPAELQANLPDHPGVKFVWDIVMSRAGDASQRAAARDRLATGLTTDMGTWREAWRRVAIGRSLLMEEKDADRTAGLFQLLHLPARFARSQKYLANLALAEVCLELDRRGDPDGMAAIRAELESQGPNTPALIWLDQKLQQRRPASSGSPQAVDG